MRKIIANTDIKNSVGEYPSYNFAKIKECHEFPNAIDLAGKLVTKDQCCNAHILLATVQHITG